MRVISVRYPSVHPPVRTGRTCAMHTAGRGRACEASPGRRVTRPLPGSADYVAVSATGGSSARGSVRPAGSAAREVVPSFAITCRCVVSSACPGRAAGRFSGPAPAHAPSRVGGGNGWMAAPFLFVFLFVAADLPCRRCGSRVPGRYPGHGECLYVCLSSQHGAPVARDQDLCTRSTGGSSELMGLRARV